MGSDQRQASEEESPSAKPGDDKSATIQLSSVPIVPAVFNPNNDGYTVVQTVNGRGNIVVGGSLRDSTIIQIGNLRDGDLQAAVRRFRPTPFTLPAPPSDFTGRHTELATILSLIERTGAPIIGIRGIGGVGKTALALEAAHRLAGYYQDATLYLDLLGASRACLSARQAQSRLIHALVPDAPLPDDRQGLRDMLLTTLSHRRGLLLLDDARDAKQVRPLLPPSGWAVLVTSRRRFALPGMKAIELDRLPSDKARELLQMIADHLVDTHATKISDLCGHLPLALRLAGSTLQSHPGLRPESYIRQLSTETERISRLDRAVRLDPSVPGIEATLTLSYGQMRTELQRRWADLSIFPGAFDSLAAAAVWGLDAAGDEIHDVQSARVDVEATELLGELYVRSMIESDQIGRYRLHDIARLAASAKLLEGERNLLADRHAAHYCQILANADERYLRKTVDAADALSLLDAEWPNIIIGQRRAAMRVGDKDGDHLVIAYAHLGAHVLSIRLPPRERMAWLECALNAARRLRRRADQGTILSRLGLAHFHLGELGPSIDLQQQSLQIMRDLRDRRGESNALGNLGIAHLARGDLHVALELHLQALDISREIGDRRGEGQDLGHLGLTYADLGEADHAIDYLEQSLAIARELGDRRDAANAVGNLGRVFRTQNETQKALDYCREHLSIAREIGDRRSEGGALGEMSLVYRALSDATMALACAREYLAIAREIGDRLGESAAHRYLGLSYLDAGASRTAIEHFESEIKITRETLDKRGEASAWLNLAYAWEKVGDSPASIDAAEQALAIIEELGGPLS